MTRRLLRLPPLAWDIATAAALAVVALCLSTPGVAMPGDRFTPPTFTGSDEHVQCRVVNVSGAKRTVQIEARDGVGNPVPSSDCFPALNPFQAPILAGDVSTLVCNGGGPRYCRFTVVGTASTAIRGTMEVRNDATLAVIVVIPAE